MSEKIKDTNVEELDIELEGQENEVILLEDEDGNEIAFHYIATLEFEGKEYVYLQVANQEELEDDDVVVEIYQLEVSVEKGEQYDSLLPVDDILYDKLYQRLLDSLQEQADECECGEDCHCGDGCGCGCNDDKDQCECDCHK